MYAVNRRLILFIRNFIFGLGLNLDLGLGLGLDFGRFWPRLTSLSYMRWHQFCSNKNLIQAYIIDVCLQVMQYVFYSVYSFLTPVIMVWSSTQVMDTMCRCCRKYCLTWKMTKSKKVFLRSTVTSSLHSHLNLTCQSIVQHTLPGQFIFSRSYC